MIVGWRGMDQHFVALLKDGLNDPEVHVVCGGAPHSADFIERVTNAGVRARFHPLDPGFTSYVTERVGDRLFRA